MKKLFYLLLCLPLAFAACTPEEDQTAKSYVLTLTSEATLNFGAEGGQGVITFALNEATRTAAALEVEATCDAAWVSDLKVAETITFVVAANDGDARETKVVVKYGDQSAEVAVKQEAKGEEPQPEYVLDVELAAAMRFPSEEYDIAENAFALMFVDDAENHVLQILITGAEGEVILQAGEYEVEDSLLEIVESESELEFEAGKAVVALAEEVYSFDITLNNENGAYHFTYEGVVLGMEPSDNPNPKPEPQEFNPVKVEAYRAGSWDLGNFELDLYIDEENYHSLDMQDYINPNENYLSAGQYTIDNGGVTSWSNFLWNIETGEGAYVVDADITLAHNEDGTTTITGFFESEYGDHLILNWTGVVEGFTFGGETPEPADDIVFNAPYFAGEYYEPGNGISTHNYYFILTDGEGEQAPNATYFYFDLYADSTDDSHTIPNGVYTYDPNDSCDAFTCASYYTYGFMTDANGDPATWYIYNGGTITVTDNKIEAVLTLENGATATITYEGNLALAGVGEGSTLSTLTSDIEVNGTDWTHLAQYYGDYYTADTDNWFVEIYEDPFTGNGGYLLLDLLADPSNDNWAGTYTAPDNSLNFKNKFMLGGVEDGYMTGCWYAELAEGSIAGTMAPIVGGTITVIDNNNDSFTIVLDCVDDKGYKITGSVTANAYAGGYSAKSLSAKKSSPMYPTMKSMVVR